MKAYASTKHIFADFCLRSAATWLDLRADTNASSARFSLAVIFGNARENSGKGRRKGQVDLTGQTQPGTHFKRRTFFFFNVNWRSLVLKAQEKGFKSCWSQFQWKNTRIKLKVNTKYDKDVHSNKDEVLEKDATKNLDREKKQMKTSSEKFRSNRIG